MPTVEELGEHYNKVREKHCQLRNVIHALGEEPVNSHIVFSFHNRNTIGLQQLSVEIPYSGWIEPLLIQVRDQLTSELREMGVDL